jgi:hypothetical protein
LALVCREPSGLSKASVRRTTANPAPLSLQLLRARRAISIWLERQRPGKRVFSTI